MQCVFSVLIQCWRPRKTKMAQAEVKHKLRVATVQFEPVDNDKSANLATIKRLAERVISPLTHAGAAARASTSVPGAPPPSAPVLVVFHECCITGYSFLQTLDREELLAIAEPVPGPSTTELGAIARHLGVAIGAGLVEREGVPRRMHCTVHDPCQQFTHSHGCVSCGILVHRARTFMVFHSIDTLAHTHTHTHTRARTHMVGFETCFSCTIYANECIRHTDVHVMKTRQHTLQEHHA